MSRRNPSSRNTMSAVMMMTPTWAVRAWAPLLWQAEHKTPPPFSHLGTRVSGPPDSRQPCHGQTFWGGSFEDGEAGLAWDWVQMGHSGVVAMADPMSVVTNLCLLGPRGEVLTAWEAARYLNTMVQLLPWQEAVERTLERKLLN
jgi:hypothetical protein